MAAAAAAPTDSLQPKNYYDRHRVHCTCDDRTQASRLSGQTWNIVNNREDHEVYLREVRNSDHFIDERGNATKHWFQRKKRMDLDGDGVIDTVDSSNVAEIMVCPKTAGKEESPRSIAVLATAAALATRPRTSVRDNVGNSARRQRPGTSGRTAPGVRRRRRRLRPARPRASAGGRPGRGGDLERRVPCQERLRDLPIKPTPRMADRGSWTSRRGEPRIEQQQPQEHDMFRKVDQLRAESHADVREQGFATALHSARGGSLAGTGASALSGANTARSQFVGREGHPATLAASLRSSAQRMEANDAREISSWPFRQDKLQRQDAYHVKPLQATGSSSVKYDIISNERRQFWY